MPRLLNDEAEGELRRQEIWVRDDVFQKIEKTIPNNNTHTTKQKRTHNSFLNTKKHQEMSVIHKPWMIFIRLVADSVAYIFDDDDGGVADDNQLILRHQIQSHRIPSIHPE